MRHILEGGVTISEHLNIKWELDRDLREVKKLLDDSISLIVLGEAILSELIGEDNIYRDFLNRSDISEIL